MRGAGLVCLAVLLLLCSAGVASAAWDGTVNTTWYKNEIAAGHTGDPDNPFLIYDAKSLAALANETNNNQSQNGFFEKHILLKTNLDLNGAIHLWTPIGNTTVPTPSSQIFKGTFDGNGKTISNMNVTTISSSNYIYVGLFGYVKNATIRNVGVVNANVFGTYSGSAYVSSGGLAGYVDGSTITNCYATGVITTESSSYNTYSGGLMGFARYSSITNCNATSVVTAPSHSGGLVGKFDGCSITNCFATGAVSVTDHHPHAGGLVGETSGGSITNCYATGAVTAASSSSDISAGGLVGLDGSTTIENCYATGVVTAASSNSKTSAGGLVGLASQGSITNSVALNPWVNASGSGPINTGRFIGRDESTTLNNLYAWRYMELNISGTSIRPVPAGDSNATNASTEMIWDNQAFYEDLSWDVTKNWTMGHDTDYRLPVLTWQSIGPVVDALYLNITHAVNATVIGTGGSITPSGKQNYKDGASVTFTLNADPGSTVDTVTDNGITQSISNSYTISDVVQPHEIIVTFRSSPVPPVPPSGDSSGNMDNAYRVLFDTSGGSLISPVTGLSSDDVITAPPAPVKDGYTFGGWYADEDCTKAWSFADGIPGDMTLYAKWIGGDTPQATAKATTEATTVPVPTQSPTASVTTPVPAGTTAAGAQPTLTQAPAPFFGMLAGLLAAGVLLWRRE
ncbi:MAG TPA: InlB B-repeat-containing protein [Methanocorpusculum sp.]|nr:InlB B-repeat-containing protein [Methanocorpusculum sp.]HJK79409.1 InlB B-repeat-containing protein [Methanocorpusculum sp.]